MRRMRGLSILLGLVMGVGTAIIPLTGQAAGPGEQEFAKGESLLKSKQYAEARTTLESGILKDPSNIQAHFNLAEACRALEAWACAEEHYDTA